MRGRVLRTLNNTIAAKCEKWCAVVDLLLAFIVFSNLMTYRSTSGAQYESIFLNFFITWQNLFT